MSKAFTKVPDVTALFWLIKILTTGIGETTSDYLVHVIDPPIAIGLVAIIFAASLVLQFAVRSYIPWIYWLAVLMVSVFGTMVADVIHVFLGVPYIVSTGCLLLLLIVLFGIWSIAEGTLSVHSINTRRREGFYWGAVLTTFALGTAAGDMTATSLELGYLASGVLFAFLFVLPGLAFRFFGLNAITAFWCAYIITRPLGASFADWMGVNLSRGGLDWGTGPVSLIGAAIVVALVGLLTVQGRKQSAVAPNAAV